MVSRLALCSACRICVTATKPGPHAVHVARCRAKFEYKPAQPDPTQWYRTTRPHSAQCFVPDGYSSWQCSHEKCSTFFVQCFNSAAIAAIYLQNQSGANASACDKK